MKRGGFRRGVRETSREAYRYAQRRGITGAQAVRIAVYLFDSPPRTRAEIARDTGIPINAVCGRVNELVKAHAVDENSARPCTTSGRMAHPVTTAR